MALAVLALGVFPAPLLRSFERPLDAIRNPRVLMPVAHAPTPVAHATVADAATPR
jgi:hypothetical protein